MTESDTNLLAAKCRYIVQWQLALVVFLCQPVHDVHEQMRIHCIIGVAAVMVVVCVCVCVRACVCVHVCVHRKRHTLQLSLWWWC